MLKKFILIIPGFRTGVKWKKIISSVVHVILLIIIIVLFSYYPNYSDNSMDKILDVFTKGLFIVGIIVVPYILCTNILGLRNKIPFFNKKTIMGFIGGVIFTSLLTLIGLGGGIAVSSSFYSEQYRVQQNANYEKVKIIKLKQKEDKKQSELVVKEKIEAEKEAKKFTKLQSEVKENLEKDAKEKAELEGKLKTEAEKEDKKKAELEAKAKSDIEAKVKADLAAKKKEDTEKAEAETNKVEDNKKDKKDNASLANKFFSWFDNISNEDYSVSTDTLNNASSKIKDVIPNNKYIEAVKNSQREEYSNTTYESAFKNFFANPSWRFLKADNGQKVVEFSGNCTYADTIVKAKIQFLISQDESVFEVGAVAFNDVPQTVIMTNALINVAFENALKK